MIGHLLKDLEDYYADVSNVTESGRDFNGTASSVSSRQTSSAWRSAVSDVYRV